MEATTDKDEVFDLIICGGGLAGLCLARQLSLSNNNFSVMVLERLKRPLPEAAFKVGESTIEPGAFYYSKTLRLEDYLRAEQLEKLGLRYFYRTTPGGDFASRPEYGVSNFLPAPSFQLDRGKLENHLRDLVDETGMLLKEGVLVKDIIINKGSEPHEVIYQEGDRLVTARARWVVDALGRRRLLQRKFNLMKESPGQFNSSWWRVRGKLDINSFVPKSNTTWHARVAEDRWQSTNHIMDQGYWVWLIPLAPDNTSVGIVTSEEFHPFSEYNTYEKSLAWLRKHEPLVAEALKDFELLDFKVLKDYSYTSKQAFSIDRWTCVGEAAVFADPYYSVGSNMIAYANGFTQRMMELDRRGELTQEYVDYCNRFFLAHNEWLTDTIHRGYRLLFNGPVAALKTLWDYFIGWGTSDPQLYHELYLDMKLAKVVSGLVSQVVLTQARMLEMFEEWVERESHYTFDFVDYIADQPTLTNLFVKNLGPKTDDVRRIINNIREGAERVEELAHVIFFLMVRDQFPEKVELFKENPWINIAAISMHPERWEADGLFLPKTRPRDLSRLEAEMCRLFVYKDTGKPVEPIFSRTEMVGA
jgi:flavin-dependent dehydrogenase